MVCWCYVFSVTRRQSTSSDVLVNFAVVNSFTSFVVLRQERKKIEQKMMRTRDENQQKIVIAAVGAAAAAFLAYKALTRPVPRSSSGGSLRGRSSHTTPSGLKVLHEPQRTGSSEKLNKASSRRSVTPQSHSHEPQHTGSHAGSPLSGIPPLQGLGHHGSAFDDPRQDGFTPRTMNTGVGHLETSVSSNVGAASTDFTERHDNQEEFVRRLKRFSLQRTGNTAGNASGEEELFDESCESRRAPVEDVGYQKGRRGTVWGHSTNIDESRTYQPQVAPKLEEEKAAIREALRRCHLFAHLDEEELNAVVDTMERCNFTQGELITRAGEVTEIDRHKLFVVLSGEVSVIEDNTVIRVISSGACFGESHIMFIQPRTTYTHRVDTPTAMCFSLEATAYRHIVTRAAVNKRELYEGFLDRVSWLKGLTRREKIQLADCLQPVLYRDGEYLIEYNTLGEFVFVILEGVVDVFGRDRNGEVILVCSFGAGDCVGELEFINHHRTVADVRAKGRVKAARLHRDHFEMCMGPIVDVLKRTATADEKYAYYQSVIRTMRRAEG